MARLGPKSYRPIFASHSSLRIQQRQARPICNDNNNVNICLRFFHGEAMAQWDNCALLSEGSRLESGWATVEIDFHNVFPVRTEKSLSAFKSSSQIPHQSFRAQTASLLTPAFGPLIQPEHFKIYFRPACLCKMNRHRQNGSSFVEKEILTCLPREIRRGLKANKRVTTLLSLYPHSFSLLSVLSARVLFSLAGYARNHFSTFWTLFGLIDVLLLPD